METKHIYIVRHGETVLNHSHRHQFLSTPLNERGIAQAHTAAKILQDISIDTIFTSDATRTLETAQILQGTINNKLPIIKDKIFREIQRPEYILGSYFWSARSILYLIRLYLYSGSAKWPYKNGENMKALKVRAKHVLSMLSTASGTQIVVVSHRLFINMILNEIYGKSIINKFSNPLEFLRELLHMETTANGSIIELLYNPNEHTQWSIINTRQPLSDRSGGIE